MLYSLEIDKMETIPVSIIKAIQVYNNCFFIKKLNKLLEITTAKLNRTYAKTRH